MYTIVYMNSHKIMKTLLKQYHFRTDMQYFEMIVETFRNGQVIQAVTQFKAMPKAERKMMVKCIFSTWQSGLTESYKLILIDHI